MLSQPDGTAPFRRPGFFNIRQLWIPVKASCGIFDDAEIRKRMIYLDPARIGRYRPSPHCTHNVLILVGVGSQRVPWPKTVELAEALEPITH